MAYNEDLAKRIGAALKIFPEPFTEKKMFGGLAYLYKGKMTVGAINEDLMVRISSDKINVELEKEFVRPMDFTGKPMKEFIFVSKKMDINLRNIYNIGLNLVLNMLNKN